MDSVNAKDSQTHAKITVSKILIHPIKSCRGISVESAHYTQEGLAVDRLWCIIDATKLCVITARIVPKMVLIAPSLNSDGTLRLSFPDDSGCGSFSVSLRPSEDILRTWTLISHFKMWPDHPPLDGYVCEAISSEKGTASAILSQYFEKPVHLVFKGPRPRSIDPTPAFPDLVATAKYQDMYPLLILSAESMAVIDDEVQKNMDTLNVDKEWGEKSVAIERFRPNIILQGGGPFSEDGWKEIAIGSANAPSMTLVSRCSRCLLPNVNPDDGGRDKAVPYKVLMKFRSGMNEKGKLKAYVGCNAVPAGEGMIQVGDVVHIRQMYL